MLAPQPLKIKPAAVTRAKTQRRGALQSHCIKSCLYDLDFRNFVCLFVAVSTLERKEQLLRDDHSFTSILRSSQVVNHIGKLMGENCATLVSVDWFFTLRDTGLDVTASQREYRTETRYSNVQYSAPELLPLSSLHASILSRALTENITVLDLRICGTSGSFYRNFTAVMGDEQAAYLAVGIEASKSLRSVVLSYNR
tara:strand:- start:1475 stop:2065 length:591 start_codon:yes stop_codon:yes gene_type:complete